MAVVAGQVLLINWGLHVVGKSPVNFTLAAPMALSLRMNTTPACSVAKLAAETFRQKNIIQYGKNNRNRLRNDQ